jgi:hypothetical protein
VEAVLRAGLCDAARLAIVGDVLGLVAYFSTLNWRWLLRAIVLLANWPYTILMIMRIDRRVDRDCQVVTPVVTRRCSGSDFGDLSYEIMVGAAGLEPATR